MAKRQSTVPTSGYQQTFAKGQKQQLLAQALAGRAFNPPQHEQGRIVADTGFADELSTLAAAMASRRMGKKADATIGQADQEKQRMQAAALQGFNTPPNMVQTPEAQNPFARAQTGLEAGLDPNVVSEYMRTQRPATARGDPADIAGYKLAKNEGYGGTFADYLKEFHGREVGEPSTVRAARYYEGLTPDQRSRFIEANRTIPIEDVNQVPTRVLAGGQQQPLSSLPSEANAAQVIKNAEATGSATGEATGKIEGGIQTRGANAVGTLSTLDEVDQLIDKATGSLLGAGVNAAAGAFGSSTEGGEAIAKLKVMQANLMTSMPRMEGPQSDRDVQLYREAAGQIGDPTVPKGIKKAAVQTIRTLQNKYVARAGGSAGGEDPELEALLSKYAGP